MHNIKAQQDLNQYEKGLIMHVSLLNDTHLVPKDLEKTQ